MAERRNDWNDPQRRDETTDPRNPPNSVVEPELRKTPAFEVVGMWYYLGPLVLIAVVVGFALFFWRNDPEPDDLTPAVGTVGEGRDETPGGGDPATRPGSVREESELRGAGEPPQDNVPGLSASEPVTSLDAVAGGDARTMSGRRIDLQDVSVVDARDRGTIWIQDGGAKVAVAPPPGSPSLRAGARVNVSGVLEPGTDGTMRIRATRITVK
jgi:hypothetical protein